MRLLAPFVTAALGRALLPHGGARNRRGRQSRALTAGQCEAVIIAAKKAWQLGLPLNRMITIHLELAGVADVNATEAIGQFVKLYREWLGSANAALLWVRENGPDKGSHVHILLHIPEDRKLVGRTVRWLKLVSGRRMARGTIHTRSIPRGQSYANNLEEAVGYLLKGASPEAVAALGLLRHEEGGLIAGKRCGGTRNIWTPIPPPQHHTMSSAVVAQPAAAS